MGAWWELVQTAALVGLAVQVWRLSRAVRRLAARRERESPSRSSARPAGSFATLVSGYLELMARRPGLQPPAPRPQPSPAPDAQPPERHRPVIALLRQGLGADEVAARLGMPAGEVQVLERVARARGWL